MRLTCTCEYYSPLIKIYCYWDELEIAVARRYKYNSKYDREAIFGNGTCLWRRFPTPKSNLEGMGFTWGSNNIEIPKASNIIGWEQHFGSKEFIAWSESQAWENEVALTWHHFFISLHQSQLQKTLRPSWELGWNLEYISKAHEGVFWSSRLLDPNPNVNPP